MQARGSFNIPPRLIETDRNLGHRYRERGRGELLPRLWVANVP